MSCNNLSRQPPRPLSTPVRLGVAAVAACFFAAPLLAAPPVPTTNLPTNLTNLVGIDAKNIVYSANRLDIVTSAARSAADVSNFNIAAGYSVGIVQPSASANVLFRVLSNDPSVIYGSLSSNGGVYLVNPGGIFVGPGGQVDVARFAATTLAIGNADFLAGRNLFVNDGTAQNVINQGEIKTPAGGSVYLIGSNVSNEGIITTPQGETILAAGATVSLIDSALPGVKVDITGATGNSTNLGTITAEAGRIGIAGVIVRNSGTLNASSVVNEGGRIFLKASQDAYVDGNGRIVTTGTKGGSVEVLGNRVAVMDKASIDASATSEGGDGGTIKVGGDYQGKNPDIQNASITYFGPDASLKADAGKVGAGGTVIVWADDTTRAYGNISVRGGASGGDGGFAEVSGKRYLDFQASVDRRAPFGKAGTLLLDPADITIGDSSDDYGGATFSGGTPNIFSGVDTAYGSHISWGTIDSQLGMGDVAITTSGTGGNGDITLIDDHWYSSSYSLSMLAHRNINAAGRTLANDSNGAIVLIAGWDGIDPAAPAVGAGPGSINAPGATFSTVGGDITLKAKNSITVGSLITTGYDGGEGSSGGHAGHVTVHSVSGTINVATIEARGGSGGDDSSWDGGEGGDGGTVSLTASGQITVGSIDATGGRGGDSVSDYGGDGGEGGTINLTSTGGAVVASAGSYIDTSGGLGGDGGEGGGNGGWSATITVEASSNIALGWLKADQVSLTSVYGGSSGGIAISAFTEATSSLFAEVSIGASYGGISIANFGAQPSSGISLTDNASNPGSGLNSQPMSIAFYNSEDLEADMNVGFSTANSGDIAITSGGHLDYTTAAISSVPGNNNILLGAGGNLTMDAGMTTTGNIGLSASGLMTINSAVQGANVTAAASTVGGPGSIAATNDAIVIGTTEINIGSGLTVSGADVFLGGGTLNLEGASVTATTGNVEFNLGSVNGTGGYISAYGDIIGIVSGDISLDTGAYFMAGNDVSLTLKGATSTIALSNGGYILATNPNTIHLGFAARSSGGVMIDGIETTKTVYPGTGSGFFVVNTSTPATEGFGLEIAYARNAAVDICTVSPDLCKPPAPNETPIDDDAPPPFSKPDKDKKASCEEGSFGCEETQANDGKKDEKPSEKKVAQCAL